MKTTAAVLYKINKPLKIEELIIPAIKPGQVLVRVVYSGICRSQINEIRGLKGEDKFLPHTLGHEGSGVVEAIGSGVSKVKMGDRVVLTWIKGFGIDVSSTVYEKENNLPVNSGAISTFLTRAVVSENRVVKIPDDFSLKAAALFGCAIPTGAGIVMNVIDVSGGKSVAIFGVGGIGLSALLAAKNNGASKIIAIDISEDRLKQAIFLGADYALNAKKNNVVESIMKITENKGVDYAVETAGKKESMEMAFKSVCDKGGLCIIAGNLSYGQTIQVDPFDFIKGKCLIGTWGGETRPDRDIPMYADWVVSGKIDPEKLISRIFTLKNINEAIEYMEQRAVGRVLIEMEER